MLVTAHGNGMVIRYKKNDYSSRCLRKEGAALRRLRVSAYTDHIVINYYNAGYKGTLFDSEDEKVKDIFGFYSDFTEEFLFTFNNLS